MKRFFLLSITLVVFRTISLCISADSVSWDEWWSYEGFSGPEFWGLVNPDWKMCAKGHRQSPINIDPKSLLFDPSLTPVKVEKSRVGGVLENTGQFLKFTLDDKPTSHRILIEDGPFGAYQYRVHHIVFHFGLRESQGSEHSVAEEKFPAEIQVIAYNTLYSNFTEAMRMPYGLAAIASLVEIESNKKPENIELKQIITGVQDVLFKGKRAIIHSLSVHHLLPPTNHYVTYDGSLTYPGCYETVTWIVMNKPVYVSLTDLKMLRDTQRSGDKQSYPIYLGDNFRPLRLLNNRLLRTNINFKTKGSACPTMYKDMYYKANPWRRTNRFDEHDLGL